MKESITDLFLKFLIVQKQYFEKYVNMFHQFEKNGFHILKTGFYSPIPIIDEIPEEFFSKESSTVDWNEQGQINNLKNLSKYALELKEVFDKMEIKTYNPSFGWHDAPIYYSIIRHFKPEKIIEVGAGESTKIAHLASQKNESTKIEIIDPFINKNFKEVFTSDIQIIKKPVQEIPVSFFQNLKKNDILFIDSTHVSKAGSDVNYLYLDILPKLKPGVLIHIHDIFLPYSYPKEWMKDKLIFWNEQYLLHAFLIGNKNFEIIIANTFLQNKHPDLLKKIMDSEPVGGTSFWMRKIQ